VLQHQYRENRRNYHAAALQAYLWPLDQNKPWPCLPVRLYKAKRAMRMTAANPGQSNMLLTGELAGKDCTSSQLLQATHAAVKAAMRCSGQRAAAAAAARSSWQLLGQRGHNMQQQQQQQQQLVGQLLQEGAVAAMHGSNSSAGRAVGELQQLLSMVTTEEAAAADDSQVPGHPDQQQPQQLQQQQQQQLLLQAVQRQEAAKQQQQQLSSSSPSSTNLLQRIGASLWSRRSSRSTSETAAPEPAPAAQAPSELAGAGAAGEEPSSKVTALAASIQQLLAALRQVAAAAAHAIDEADYIFDKAGSCCAAAASGQEQLLDSTLQLQQHQLCSAEEAAELCCMLRSILQLRHAILQVPGFSCSWGLDAAGSDAQLRYCGRPATGSVDLLHAPVVLDSAVAAAVSLQALSNSCNAVQVAAAAAAAEAGAGSCESAAAAGRLVQQLTQELGQFPASIGALQALHSQQLQAAEEAGKPCLAVLRVWRLHAQQQCSCSTPQQLSPDQQQLVLPFVVLCSERSVGVSPCGRLLVAVVAVQPACSSSRAAEAAGQLDASKDEFYKVGVLRCSHGAACSAVFGTRQL
jgi:hypothetical protein